MKRSIISLILLTIISVSVSAQSRITYIGMSALLPGSGEIALGKTQRGVALLASELLATYAFLKTDTDMALQKENYKIYANCYAGVPLDMPQDHYQSIQAYQSSEDYNQYLEMIARNYYLITNYDPQGYEEFMAEESFSGDEQWTWQSEMHWQRYIDMRKKHQKTKINHNLALGVMLFNRALSMVDTALISRNLHLHAQLSGTDGMMLNCELRF